MLNIVDFRKQLATAGGNYYQQYQQQHSAAMFAFHQRQHQQQLQQHLQNQQGQQHLRTANQQSTCWPTILPPMPQSRLAPPKAPPPLLHSPHATMHFSNSALYHQHQHTAAGLLPSPRFSAPPPPPPSHQQQQQETHPFEFFNAKMLLNQ